jgi:hypothetical protein
MRSGETPHADAARESRTPAEGGAAPRTADSATVQLTDEQGNSTRIRVSVRGELVSARILSSDPGVASRIEGGLNELQKVLGSQGFSDTRVTVQSAVAPNERAAAGLGVSLATAAETPGNTRGPETPTEDRRQGSGGRDLDRQADQRQGQSHGRSQQRHRREKER